jgi:uncharacterized membrane protein
MSITKGEVVKIISETTTTLPGTDIVDRIQEIVVSAKTGDTINVTNSYSPVTTGQKVYIEETVNQTGSVYNVVTISREPTLIFLTGLFILITLLVGKKKGLRGLVSLVVTIFVIFAFLVPKILEGKNTFVLILLTTIFLTSLSALITHGKNRVTYSAILGMLITLVVTAFISILASISAGLTGNASESSVYFMVAQNGTVNMRALFLGAVLIGLMGVLYDAAVSQAVYVAETIKNNTNISKKDLLASAMRFGREHIGALVDTLAIVSIGAALVDTLLIVQHAVGPLGMILSNESVASHILQILVGSIGVILAIPVTTFIAIKILYGTKINKTHNHIH